MKVIVITPEQKTPHESILVNRILAETSSQLHIRKPNYTQTQLESYLDEIPSLWHPKLVIHSHWMICEKYNLKGIHLTEKDKSAYSASDVLAMRNEGWQVSASFHTMNDIIDNDGIYDYVFLSPIFDSISKQDYTSHFEINDLQNLFKKNILETPVIALGGVTKERIHTLREIGFHGVAGIGGLWNSPDLIRECQEWSAE